MIMRRQLRVLREPDQRFLGTAGFNGSQKGLFSGWLVAGGGVHCERVELRSTLT